MRTSQRGLELIASFEGFVPHAYKPVPWERYWTIGYGHYGPDVKAGQRITQEAALHLLSTDVHRYEAAVNGIGAHFNQNQFDALVSLAYNCGPGAVQGSIARYAREGNMGAIPGVMRLYVHAGGRTLPGLVRRREAEIALFRSRPADAKAKALSHLLPDELAWAREYDRLRAAKENLPRRRELRALMKARRKEIWRAAKKYGWKGRDRSARYHSLLARTA